MKRSDNHRACIRAALTLLTSSLIGCTGDLEAFVDDSLGATETLGLAGESSSDSGSEGSEVGGQDRVACAVPYTLVTQAGVYDNYKQPGEPANLTAAIKTMTGLVEPSQWVAFDSLVADHHFGHTFELDFDSLFGYQYGYLTLRLRPKAASQFDNDTLALWATGASAGWGVTLVALPNTKFVADKETIVTLDLTKLVTGSSTVLQDINAFNNLNVYLQDDMAGDSMTLALGGSAPGQKPADVPLVGVLMDSSGCGALPQYSVLLDNEDKKNANGRGGWIGGVSSGGNTQFEFCAVNGDLFIPAAQAGASFAVIALAGKCPAGFVTFTRYHDNEDNNAASWDNTPGASLTATVGSKKDTNMTFCVSSGNKAVANAVFPGVGIPYGVFGGRTPAMSPWALTRGWLGLDDEDKNNKNSPGSQPSYTTEFLVGGGNTVYYVARVK